MSIERESAQEFEHEITTRRLILPGERRVEDLPEGEELVAFVPVEGSTKQLRTGRVSSEGTRVEIALNEPTFRFVRSGGPRPRNPYAFTMGLQEPGLMRRVDYDLLRNNSNLVDRWTASGEAPNPKDLPVLRQKLHGPGIEQTHKPFRPSNGESPIRS